MRDDDELGVVAPALLTNGLDGDAVLGECLRHRGEHARPVVDVDGDVVAGAGLPHRQHGPVGVRRLADAAGALRQVGFSVSDVDDYPSPVGRTTVLFRAGSIDAARTVARHLTGGAALVESDNVKPGDAVLVIGKDFTTVHDQIAPDGSTDDVRSTTSTTTPGSGGSTATTAAPTTTTTVQGYATGEPPPGVTCG